MRILLVAFVAAVSAGCSDLTGPDMTDAGTAPASQTARYRVRFESRWSASTHPLDFPSDAHFSRLVGANHAAGVSFWRAGLLATPGIQAMAERGRVTPLDTEVMSAIAAGTAEAVFTGPALDQTPDAVSMEVTASQRFPLLTLVTMVAPSPDWFVGVAGLPLFDNGQWVAERRVDLEAWDAGTDSGQSFSSPDQVTAPFVPITRIVTAPLSPDGRVTALGSFVFTRMP